MLALIGAATFIAHSFVEWVERRFLVISGAEYILLGVLLGPAVAGQVQGFQDLTSLAPVIAFAAGWVGLLYGMELRIGIPESGHGVRLAMFDVAATALSLGVASWYALTQGWFMEPVAGREATIAAVALGCAGAAGSSTAVDLLRSRFSSLETELLPLLRRSARIGDMMAIVGFGLIFCVFHEGATRMDQPPGWTAWLLISLLLGFACGWVFSLFLGDEPDENHLFLALVGILVFASGAAFFLNLSALMVNVVLGAIIVNRPQGPSVASALERTAGPVRIVLLVFAGALWVPVDPSATLALTGVYVLLRLIAKYLGSWIATVGTPLRSDIARGMMAQGGVAIAMAISLKLVYTGPAIDLAYTVILLTAMIHEGIAPRLLKGLLIDAGELRHEQETLMTAGR